LGAGFFGARRKIANLGEICLEIARRA